MPMRAVIGKEPQDFLDRLEGNPGNAIWVNYNCEIKTEAELQEIMRWLLDIRAIYLVVNLSKFDKTDCKVEKQLSDFCHNNNIAVHFFLPENLSINYVKAMQLSQELQIYDLWTCSLRGKDLLEKIDYFIQLKQQTAGSFKSMATQ